MPYVRITISQEIRRSSVFALDGGAFFRSHEQGGERHLFRQVDGPLGAEPHARRAWILDSQVASMEYQSERGAKRGEVSGAGLVPVFA